MSTRSVRFAAAVALGLTLGQTRHAGATLGGDAASVAQNQEHLRATRRVKSLAAGQCHELQVPSGPVVHEYLSPGGSVYAVSWRGHGMPDLRELLGPYFSQLGTGHRRGGRHQMALTGRDLVVESSGHGRFFSGRAWVPSLVPAGVDAASTVGNEE